MDEDRYVIIETISSFDNGSIKYVFQKMRKASMPLGRIIEPFPIYDGTIPSFKAIYSS